MLHLYLAAAAVAANPAAAPAGKAGASPSVHVAPPAPPPAVQAAPQVRDTAPIDPQRLALGREIAQAFMPPGSAQRMMTSLGDVRANMIKQMFGVSPKDLGAKAGKDSNQTLGELIRQKDPYFEQRMAITNRVMMEGFGKLMSEFEPQLRESMARAYARRFSMTELSDLSAFLRTPSGKSFASQLMAMTNDPDYQKALSELAPRLMQAMPGIMENVKKATATLPPPPKDSEAKPAELPSS